MKIQNISKYVMLGVMAISAIVFGLFFGLWGDEKMGEYDAPKFTDLLLVLMYLLAAVTTLLVVWAVVKGIASTRGNDSAATTGVPGSKIITGTCLLFIGSMVFG